MKSNKAQERVRAHLSQYTNFNKIIFAKDSYGRPDIILVGMMYGIIPKTE